MTYNSGVRRLAACALIVVFGATASGLRIAAAPAQSTAPTATLVELRAPADLEARFNEDRGKTRIVLLVSPT